MKKGRIKLDMSNFHGLFGAKTFEEGQLVWGFKQYEEYDNWQLVLRIEEEPTYTVVAAAEEGDEIVIRGYREYEHIADEELKRLSVNSPEGRKLSNKLKRRLTQ